MSEVENLVGGGLNTVYQYENIAIVVLMVCLVFSGMFNIILLLNLLKVKDVLGSVALAINTLNERLSHHGNKDN